MAEYRPVATLKTAEDFLRRLDDLGVAMPFDAEVRPAPDGPLARTLSAAGRTVGNRFCVLPMEGWDADADGRPTEWTRRRWRRFGASGAKLIWGGEAVAVRADGRATPNRTAAERGDAAPISPALREVLDRRSSRKLRPHGRPARRPATDARAVFAGPFDFERLEPRILLYHHRLLDAKFGIDPNDQSIPFGPTTTLERLREDCYVARCLGLALRRRLPVCRRQSSATATCCHEFLNARNRPGKYGGDFEGRTRLLAARSFMKCIRHEACPSLMIMVRLSAFDTLPYATSREVGRPMTPEADDLGCRINMVSASMPLEPLKIDLSETIQLLRNKRRRLGRGGS